jgi:hypothetical protein
MLWLETRLREARSSRARSAVVRRKLRTRRVTVIIGSIQAASRNRLRSGAESRCHFHHLCLNELQKVMLDKLLDQIMQIVLYLSSFDLVLAQQAFLGLLN